MGWAQKDTARAPSGHLEPWQRIDALEAQVRELEAHVISAQADLGACRGLADELLRQLKEATGGERTIALP